MSKIFPVFIYVFVFLFSIPSHAQSVEGLWLTQNERSVIKVYECEEGLCGDIHWITEGGQEFDEHNPDESLRDRPLCGLKILWGFEPENEVRTKWKSGKIYKADDGDIYDANIELLEDGTLKLRGYVGISLFGKTQIWTPVAGNDFPKCGS